MIGYKHIPHQYAALFATGEQIAIGTFDYYRSLENDRGDTMEGLACFRQEVPQLFSEPPNLRQREALQAMSIVVEGGGGNCLIGNKTSWSVPSAYMFCVSKEPDTSRMNDEAIFKITDLEEFAKLLHNAHRQFLGPPEVREVQYVGKTGDPFEVPVGFGPFDKSQAFSFEKEIRMVWPTSDENHGWRLLNVPSCSRLVERLSA
jgi:hypothetical protein